MAIQPFKHVGPWDNGVYLIFDPKTRECAIVDPGMESERIWDVITANQLRLTRILNTHGHMDHIFNNAYFAEKSGADVWVHEADLFLFERLVSSSMSAEHKAKPSPAPAGFLTDGMEILIGEDTRIVVRHTPGHTPGSVSFLIDGGAVVGDTLFAGSIGRFDGPGGSGRQLIASVKTKLFVLPDDTIVYPGHGELTTIGREKQYNPFFQPGAERYITR